jgi:glycosyltransferase involved in cell wall biosynthesis
VKVHAPPASAPIGPLTERPTFSIVIRAFQSADTIGAAVGSALGQVVPAKEVIVVDDGSTDDLDRVLDSFRDRVRVVRTPHGGPASAFNAGLRIVSGDFLAVLDADDAFHPRRLEAFTELATVRPDLDVLTTDARFMVDGVAVGRFYSTTRFALEDQRTAIFDRCFIGASPAARVSRLREIGGCDEGMRVGEDWDCWLRLILHGARVGMIDEPYYDYHLHGASASGDRIASLRARVTMLEKVRNDPALRASERPALLRALRGHRTRAVLAEVSSATTSKHRSLRLAVETGVAPKARALALLAVVAPGVARRRAREDRAVARPTAASA